jgi:hypothetical protein
MTAVRTALREAQLTPEARNAENLRALTAVRQLFRERGPSLVAQARRTGHADAGELGGARLARYVADLAAVLTADVLDSRAPPVACQGFRNVLGVYAQLVNDLRAGGRQRQIAEDSLAEGTLPGLAVPAGWRP